MQLELYGKFINSTLLMKSRIRLSISLNDVSEGMFKKKIISKEDICNTSLLCYTSIVSLTKVYLIRFLVVLLLYVSILNILQKLTSLYRMTDYNIITLIIFIFLTTKDGGRGSKIELIVFDQLVNSNLL